VSGVGDDASGTRGIFAVSPDQFRALALALPGVIEAFHQGHADFRVRNKIFATLGYPDDAHGMVKLASEEQAKFVRQAPAVFAPAKGSWGEQGSTLVDLEAASEEKVRAAVRSAWERLVREETAVKAEPGARKSAARPKRAKV
jgi:hypothetical protein